MTLLSIILMGGTVLFPDNRIHQICGISLIVLFGTVSYYIGKLLVKRV